MGQDIFDLVIVVTLVIFTIRGARNGLVGEVAGIVALVGGFWAARAFNANLAPYLDFIADANLRYIAACATLFIGVMLGVGLIARLLKRIIAFSFVAWVDRFGGAAFGLAKGILIWSLLIIILDKLVGDAPFMKDSRAVPYFSAIITQIIHLLPPDLAQRFGVGQTS